MGGAHSLITRHVDGCQCGDRTRVLAWSRRRVVRWGFGPGWEPGTNVTDLADEAPEGVILVDCDGDYWRAAANGYLLNWHAGRGIWLAAGKVGNVARFAPIRVATNEQLRAAGILTDGGQA